MNDYIPDALEMFELYDAERERERNELPVCADCDQPITDDFYFEFNGECICPRCLEDLHRKENLEAWDR